MIVLSQELCCYLFSMAQKYETPEFLLNDPSQFMHRYTEERESELVAFIASALSFGRREQILSHIEKILSLSSPSPFLWVLEGAYKDFFAPKSESFYRMFSYCDMLNLFDALRGMLQKEGSLGSYIKKRTDKPYYTDIIEAFPASCKMIPHGKGSACKRVQMFLRWMVRSSSPVDLGLWSAWYKKSDLLMPLDTHVMQQAFRLSLIEGTKAGKIPSPSIKCAINLTDTMKLVFPFDPVRADFALFGYGVSSAKS